MKRSSLKHLFLILTASLVIPAMIESSHALSYDNGWILPTVSGSHNKYVGFGDHYSPSGIPSIHLGQDFESYTGDPVYAIADGEVIESRTNVGGYGPGGTRGGALVALFKTSDGLEFKALYGHINSPHSTGPVKAGDVLGYINSYNPSHLHFGIHPGRANPSDGNPWRGFIKETDYASTGETYGWVDPIGFLETHTPYGDTSEDISENTVPPEDHPASTKFNIGDRVLTTEDLNIRSSPGTEGSQIIRTTAEGELGTVTGGSIFADNYNWWEVVYDDGSTGWSAEDWLELAPENSGDQDDTPYEEIETSNEIDPETQTVSQQQDDELTSQIDQEPDTNQNEATSWAERAYELQNQDCWEEALQALDKSIELDPSNSEVWRNKGVAFYFLDRYDEAIQATEKAIEVDPRNTNAVRQRDQFIQERAAHNGNQDNPVQTASDEPSETYEEPSTESTAPPSSQSDTSGSGFPDGTLLLYVHDASSGALLSDVQVSVEDSEGNSRMSITGSDGYAGFTAQPGTWQYTASKDGYETASGTFDVTTTESKDIYLNPLQTYQQPEVQPEQEDYQQTIEPPILNDQENTDDDSSDSSDNTIDSEDTIVHDSFYLFAPYESDPINHFEWGTLYPLVLPPVGDEGYKTLSELIGIPFVSESYPQDTDYYNDRVEPYNPIVHEKALEIASEYPGEYSIDQICAIYDYVSNNWCYINDPKGNGDYINYANESIILGEREGYVGVGDCDDFAVLMAALIESIGGNARIIHTEDSEGGHAYAEVYIGHESCDTGDSRDERENVRACMWRLIQRYNSESYYDPMMIFGHGAHNHAERVCEEDIWLNLDWQADRPGGPYAKGDKSWVRWASGHSYTSPTAPPKRETMSAIGIDVGREVQKIVH